MLAPKVNAFGPLYKNALRMLRCSIVIRKELYGALTTFIPFWTQCASPSSVQNVNRLVIAFKSRSILEEKLPAASEDANMDAVAALQINNIPDLAIVNNRASLFTFLGSLVRPPRHISFIC